MTVVRAVIVSPRSATVLSMNVFAKDSSWGSLACNVLASALHTGGMGWGGACGEDSIALNSQRLLIARRKGMIVDERKGNGDRERRRASGMRGWCESSTVVGWEGARCVMIAIKVWSDHGKLTLPSRTRGVVADWQAAVARRNFKGGDSVLVLDLYRMC